MSSKSPPTTHGLWMLPSRKLWPVYVCWLLMMLATAIAMYLHEFARSTLVMCALQGVFLGEFALAAIIGGLYGRTWIAGWLLAVFLASFATGIGFCLDCVTARYYPYVSDYSRLALCSFWPLLMLSACAPMIAMRGLRGWSLTLDEDTAIPKQTSTVEDLLLLSLIVASCITLARWIEEAMPGVGASQIYFVMALFFGFSLLFVLPATAITFRARNWTQRLTGWFVMTVVVFVACVGLSWLMSEPFDLWTDLVYVGVGVSVAAATMIIGGVSLLLSGVKLTHFAANVQGSSVQGSSVQGSSVQGSSVQDNNLQSASGDEVPCVTGDLARVQGTKLQSRVLAGVVVACALVSVGVIQYANLKTLRFLQGIQSYKETFPDQVTELTIRGDTVVGATLAPSITDFSLERYRDAKQNTLERVSLAGTQITDEAIDKLVYFPKLKHLDLSNTYISNAGLEKLKKLSSLSTLTLANTFVDLELALQIAKKLGVTELDVSGIGITDGDLTSDLPLTSDLALKLSHNAITDAGIAQLLQSPVRLRKLDVSDTAINGASLVSTNCPSALNLDRTKITDANLIQILKMGFCRDVSIRSTGITAAIFPSVIPFSGLSLRLGKGNITEQDLINLPPSTRFDELSLNDAKFTGEFLRTGKFQYESLDLSGSGITDSALQNMVNFSYVYYFNLSNTNITDAGLAALTCQEVDLRSTKVSFEGVKTAQHIGRILIDHNQFPAVQLAKLRNTNVAIDGERSGDGL
ncbi:MAG: hypothetical protein SFV81_07565 [Pirellulaceae bacterium]|nr:hypothetical protein [Pirellulaceae bacterium]